MRDRPFRDNGEKREERHSEAGTFDSAAAISAPYAPLTVIRAGRKRSSAYSMEIA
jgi:hypothetical protein